MPQLFSSFNQNKNLHHTNQRINLCGNKTIVDGTLGEIESSNTLAIIQSITKNTYDLLVQTESNSSKYFRDVHYRTHNKKSGMNPKGRNILLNIEC